MLLSQSFNEIRLRENTFTMVYVIQVVALSFFFCIIRGYNTEKVEFGKIIGALLKDFNSPLKLTASFCWNTESTVKFVREINVNNQNFQMKFMKDDDNQQFSNTLDRHHEVIIVDIQCGNITNVLAQVNHYWFNWYKIIILDSSVQERNYRNAIVDVDYKVQKLFQNSAILPMSQIFYFSEASTNTFIVKQVYRPGFNEPLITEEIGFYDGNDFVGTTTLTPVLRRRNMKQFQLRASMVILFNDSLNHLDDYRDIHIDAVSKVCYRFTNYLMQFMNGSVKYSIVPTWGYKNPKTGEWNGQLGELLRNEADIASTPFFLIPERVSTIEYISCPTPAQGGFIFRSPKLSYTNNLYAMPFDRLLWICLVFLVVTIAICLCGAMIFELRILSTKNIEYRINDVAIIIFGAVCQQGSSVVPRSVTAKIILAIAFTIFMFLFVSYSANIVALLQSPSNQIKTLQDLYESKLDVAAEDTVYLKHFFPRETGKLRKDFYEHKLRFKNGTPSFMDLEEGIKKVREGLFAFYTEYSSAYKIIGETFYDVEKCGLQEIRFFKMNVVPWYAIQKNSSYKEILKIGMMRLQEHGIKQRENLIYYMKKPKCLSAGGNFVSATLIDTGPVIIILLWGFAITSFIFILELWVDHSSDIKHRISHLKEKFTNKIKSRI